jgi:phage tail-like protein
MPPVFREDPYTGYNFEVVVAGVSDDGKAVRGSFAEVSGLEVAMDPIEYRNGSEENTVRKIPGLMKFTVVSL